MHYQRFFIFMDAYVPVFIVAVFVYCRIYLCCSIYFVQIVAFEFLSILKVYFEKNFLDAWQLLVSYDFFCKKLLIVKFYNARKIDFILS